MFVRPQCIAGEVPRLAIAWSTHAPGCVAEQRLVCPASRLMHQLPLCLLRSPCPHAAQRPSRPAEGEGKRGAEQRKRNGTHSTRQSEQQRRTNDAHRCVGQRRAELKARPLGRQTQQRSRHYSCSIKRCVQKTQYMETRSVECCGIFGNRKAAQKVIVLVSDCLCGV